MFDPVNISLGQGLLVAALGIAVVFVVLIVLMGIIKLQSIAVEALENRGKKDAGVTKPDNAAPAAPPLAATPAKLAKGSCGGVMLHDVPDATAAMVMAIVADELNTPLNELRFISIQEVK